MIQVVIINVLAVVQTWSNAHWIGSVIGFPCPVLSWFPPRALWVVETQHISCNSRQMSVRSHCWCVWALSRPRHINSILDLWSSGAPALVCSGGRFFLRIFSGWWFIGITPGMTPACQFNLTPSFRSQYSNYTRPKCTSYLVPPTWAYNHTQCERFKRSWGCTPSVQCSVINFSCSTSCVKVWSWLSSSPTSTVYLVQVRA